VYVHHYVLGYPPPAPAAPPRLDAALKVERFGAPPVINTQKMLIASQGHQISQYQYHQWQGYPADMVSSLLTRDLQAARRYTAVFGPDSSQMPRFRLEGGLVRFVQMEGKPGKAELRLEVTLLDYHQKNVVKQVMFQRSYAQSEAMASSDAAAQAQALSQALAKISPRLRAEVAAAISARLAEPDPMQDKEGK